MQMETSKCTFRLYSPKLIVQLLSLLTAIVKSAVADVYIPPFQIIVCLPTETAPYTSRELRRVLAKWEVTEHVFVSSLDSHKFTPADIPMFATPLPIGSDGSAMIQTLCDALEIHNPSIVLSLLDPKKSLFSRIISATSWIPVLSFTQEYKQNPTTFQVMDNFTLAITRNYEASL